MPSLTILFFCSIIAINNPILKMTLLIKFLLGGQITIRAKFSDTLSLDFVGAEGFVNKSMSETKR